MDSLLFNLRDRNIHDLESKMGLLSGSLGRSILETSQPTLMGCR